MCTSFAAIDSASLSRGSPQFDGPVASRCAMVRTRPGRRPDVAGRDPEEDVSRPAVHQGWRDVAMLHWRYPSDVVAALLPDELEVDVVDGSAWVSLTPFMVKGFRVTGLPSLPFLSDFEETNLRTYARARD